MATTKIWPVRDSLKRLVDYAGNPEKTEYTDLRQALHYAGNEKKTVSQERMCFVTGVNCDGAHAYEQMVAVKRRFGKERGNVAYHAYQSFRPGEVTPRQCHELGLKLAQELWGQDYQVLVATHLDKEHLHNHFLVNSVSFRTGKKFNCTKSVYRRMRAVSDRLCREENLSVIQNPLGHTPRTIYFAEKRGEPTKYNLMRAALDYALESCIDFDQLDRALRDQGYILDADPNHRYATIRSVNSQKATRLYRLGENYDLPAIAERLEENWNLCAYHLSFRDYRPMRIDRRPIGVFYCWDSIAVVKKTRIGGLRGLYLHYCFRLGILPKGRKQPPLSPELREEWRRRDLITRQMTMIAHKGFKTLEDVEQFLSETEAVKNTLSAQRKGCYNRMDRSADPEEIAALRTQRDRLTRAMGLCREDIKLARSILERNKTMLTNLTAEEELRRELSRPPKRRERSYVR
jgi:hypothetical protein